VLKLRTLPLETAGINLADLRDALYQAARVATGNTAESKAYFAYAMKGRE
jgi:hypothetical protein